MSQIKFLFFFKTDVHSSLQACDMFGPHGLFLLLKCLSHSRSSEMALRPRLIFRISWCFDGTPSLPNLCIFRSNTEVLWKMCSQILSSVLLVRFGTSLAGCPSNTMFFFVFLVEAYWEITWWHTTVSLCIEYCWGMQWSECWINPRFLIFFNQTWLLSMYGLFSLVFTFLENISANDAQKAVYFLSSSFFLSLFWLNH